MTDDRLLNDYYRARSAEKERQAKMDGLLDQLGELNEERAKARRLGDIARLDLLSGQVNTLITLIAALENGE